MLWTLYPQSFYIVIAVPQFNKLNKRKLFNHSDHVNNLHQKQASSWIRSSCLLKFYMNSKFFRGFCARLSDTVVSHFQLRQSKWVTFHVSIYSLAELNFVLMEKRKTYAQYTIFFWYRHSAALPSFGWIPHQFTKPLSQSADMPFSRGKWPGDSSFFVKAFTPATITREAAIIIISNGFPLLSSRPYFS